MTQVGTEVNSQAPSFTQESEFGITTSLPLVKERLEHSLGRFHSTSSQWAGFITFKQLFLPTEINGALAATDQAGAPASATSLKKCIQAAVFKLGRLGRWK